jgi:lactoylglutathione lyase
MHVSVKDLSASIRFYQTLFGAEPAVTKADYAKWMLEDPRVNFAISTNRQPVGINHLGLQVDTDEELRGMRTQLEAADARMLEESEQPCCYARSDKYWVTDPTGIAWETFHTLGSIPVYGEDTAVFNHGESIVPVENASAQCCVPAQKAAPDRTDLQRPLFMHGKLGAQQSARRSRYDEGFVRPRAMGDFLCLQFLDPAIQAGIVHRPTLLRHRLAIDPGEDPSPAPYEQNWRVWCAIGDESGHWETQVSL